MCKNMTKQLKYTLFFVLMAVLASCRNNNANQLTFEIVQVDKSMNLSNEVQSPQCNVSLKMASATDESGEVGKKINDAVVYRLFNQTDMHMQGAMERFAEAYTMTYKTNMLPLYNEDRADTTKRSWYEFHYIIHATTEQTSKRTLAYLATIDYSEGHANSIHQLIPLNFYSDTGNEISMNKVFVAGYETQLPRLLLKALMEKTESQTLEQLKEKGYLEQVDMYVPENFIVGDNTITFIFNPSEIASLELGTIGLVLTYAQLKRFIKPAFIKSLQ
jgi:hypothetical protein